METPDKFDYLSEREKSALDEAVRIKEMSPEAVMRHALRIYDFVDHYIRQNMEICFRKQDGEIVRPLHHDKKAPYVEADSDQPNS